MTLFLNILVLMAEFILKLLVTKSKLGTMLYIDMVWIYHCYSKTDNLTKLYKSIMVNSRSDIWQLFTQKVRA
jgi:hypothetical protein